METDDENANQRDTRQRQADEAKQGFEKLGKEDRADLIAFMKSL